MSFRLNNDVMYQGGHVVPAESKVQTPLLLMFGLAHIPIALLIRSDSTFATVHAIGTLLIGIGFVLSGQSAIRVVCVATYIAGAEVLWRMSRADVPWEFVKYSAILLLALLLMRSVRHLRGVGMPLLYILLLILSVPLTLEMYGLSKIAISEISFNLSGPLCLVMSVIFFKQFQISTQDFRLMLWLLVCPIIGLATVVLTSVMATEYIYFGLGSNIAASGGYGPNQVSSMLGLGALASLIVIVMSKEKKDLPVLLVLIVWFLAQAMVTMSRGGLFSSLLCMILIGVHMLRDPAKRKLYIGITSIVLFVGGYYIIPKLDAFTEGALEKRLRSTETTQREEIAELDLQVWSENPFLGVGPGASQRARSRISPGRGAIAPHTEFTRMLSEHGIAGFASLIIIIVMGLQAYLRAPSILSKALVAGLLAWSLSEMAHSAMRLGAVPLLFGLAMAHYNIGQDTTRENQPSESKRKERIGRFNMPLRRTIFPQSSK